MNFEIVIGIEVHLELKTQRKIFSAAKVTYNNKANTEINEIDLGYPGVLPTINSEVVDFAILAGIAFKSDINEVSFFDRKNYFYPDNSKGFQITQRKKTYAENGYIELDSGKKIRLIEMHIEEDTAKSSHGVEYTTLDYNRAGTPLIEIVSNSDIRSADEAVEYLRKLKNIVEKLNISDAKLEEGSLRCDINISIRPFGYDGFNEKVEIKNLNSFNSVKNAINFEYSRQAFMHINGENVLPETKRFDEKTKKTVSMRTKENEADYHYMYEPDMLPLYISKERIAALQESMPKLPSEILDQLIKDYNVDEDKAKYLSENQDYYNYFISASNECSNYNELLKWIFGDIAYYANKELLSLDNINCTPIKLANIINLIDSNEISGSIAKKIISIIFDKNGEVSDIIDENGFKQNSNQDELLDIVKTVCKDNPESVSDYKEGKDRALKFLMGQIMKMSKGKANPQIVNELLLKELNNG